ncbi:MAG: hypothetical protein IKN65_00895 [Clostridia bacterium]|nr:hypothetical protein [Bacilli bacterium]MBR3672841.1 hypothetical protein [Clostridia bacterium]
MKKIKYTIQYHNQLGKYVLWKEVESEHGFGIKGIFNGTRKECQEYLQTLKIHK